LAYFSQNPCIQQENSSNISFICIGLRFFQEALIKLYVLSQMRAVVSGIERITPKLMRKVYEDELKPIHPMIDALRSGLKERIAKYSDLTIPHIDNKIIELSLLVQEQVEKVKSEPKFENNSSAMRLYRQLVDMGFESTLLEPLVYKAFRDNPSVGLKDIMPIVIEWYKSAEQTKPDTEYVNIDFAFFEIS
jgi:hypothetical protein